MHNSVGLQTRHLFFLLIGERLGEGTAGPTKKEKKKEQKEGGTCVIGKSPASIACQ